MVERERRWFETEDDGSWFFFFDAGKRGKEKEIGIKRCAFSLFEEKRNTTSEEMVFLSPRVER